MITIELITNKSEIGAGTRGASLGIDALKVAAFNAGSDLFNRYKTTDISDKNELLFREIQSPSAIRIDGILQVYEDLSKTIFTKLKEHKFPVVVAADHASAGGTIAGIKMAFPDKRLGVIWVDAHADLHSPYTSPTGNVHGMPLATAISEDNKRCQVNEIDPISKIYWEKLKQVGGPSPKVLPSDLVFFGVRDTEFPEDELINEFGIKNYTVDECRKIGMKEAAQAALYYLRNCDVIYLSFDVDSMDCNAVSHGTGTPVENGFLPEEVREILLKIIADEKIKCFEIVEINPTLDEHKNKMAEVSFSILDELIMTLENKE